MNWISVELNQMFQMLKEQIPEWNADDVLTMTIKLGDLVKMQLEHYTEGKYRSDRNETIGFFSAMEKFVETELPISLDHFNNILAGYQKRILPYPHYSGIEIKIPENLNMITQITINDIPSN